MSQSRPPRMTPGRRSLGRPGLVVLGLLLVAASVFAEGQGPVVGFRRVELEAGLHEVAPALAPLALDSGQASASHTNRLTDATATWEPNQWAEHAVTVAGQRCLVTTNSATELFLDRTIAAAAGDAYAIEATASEFLGLQSDGPAQLVTDPASSQADVLATVYLIKLSEPGELVITGRVDFEEPAP